MSRQYGRIFSTIWDDEDFCALTLAAQRMFFVLLSQKKLTLIGSLEIRSSRWAKLSSDGTTELTDQALTELEEHRYIVVDHTTEELVIRSFTRGDIGGGRLNINLLKGFWRAWEDMESDELRAVVVDNCPETIWVADQLDPPPRAVEMRRSRRLEPLVPTVSSNQRSEPLVRTSLSPEPSSLSPRALSPEPLNLEPADGSNQRPPAGNDPPARPLAAVTDLPLLAYGFDAFWERWPAEARVKEPEARKAWNAARGNGALEAEILQGLQRWTTHWETIESTEFIAHPSRWLRNRQWNDPTPVSRPKKSKGDEQNAQMENDITSWLNTQGAS